MLDRYVQMTLAADPEVSRVPEPEAKALLQRRLEAKKAEAIYKHRHAQCESDVTRGEYDCAMAAPTPDNWEACIE